MIDGMTGRLDWNYSSELKIFNTFEEIKDMSSLSFKNLIREHIERTAFEYLTMCIYFKGKTIIYNELKIQNYLCPEE